MGFVTCLTILLYAAIVGAQYTPDWKSIDSRPLPKWYDEAKVGIFIHFGVFSVPSFGSEWFWTYWAGGDADYVDFMKNQYPPSFTYQDFAKDLDAYFYDPDWWADLIKDSGAKYVVITSKHHEGYTNWPSNVSFSWNSVDVGPKKDIIGMLAKSIRSRTDVRFGLYHSLYEWYNPLYDQDKANGYNTDRFVQFKTMPELYEIINTYKPDVLWSDGDWEAPDYYWNSTVFLAWLYNSSPVKDTIVTNDRWGSGIMCKHGGYWTCMDRYNPGFLVPHKWENCYTLDKVSWGYRREGVLQDYLTELEVVTTLAQTVSCGGNLLLNIGPRKDGRVDPLMEERLRQMGKWLRINGEAIYGSQPWIFQNETHSPVWYTAKQEQKDDPNSAVTIYAIVLAWPVNEQNYLYLTRVSPTASTTVTMLGYSGGLLPWKLAGVESGIVVDFSGIRFYDMPSYVSWVIRIDNVAPHQQQIHPVVRKNYIAS